MLFRTRLSNISDKSNNNAIDENTNIFLYSLDLIRKSNESIRTYMESVYTDAISGTNNYVSFREAFDKTFNFDDAVNKIFTAYRDNISSIYTKGNEITNSSLINISTIKTYKKDIELFIKSKNKIDVTATGKNIKFGLKTNYEHYKYTNLDAVILSSDSESKFREFFDIIEDDIYSAISNGKDMYSMEKLKNIYYDTNSPKTKQYIDTIRGLVVGKQKKIYKDQYDTELFKYFHNGDTDSKGSIVGTKDIAESYNRFTKGKEFINEQRKLFNTSIKGIDATEKHIIDNHKRIQSYINDDRQLYLINNILKVSCNFILELCSIYTLAYAYKWDSIINAYASDRRILLYTIHTHLTNRKWEGQ